MKAVTLFFLILPRSSTFFEQHPDHFPALEKLFAQLYETGAQAITSIITYIELTTHPARLGQEQLIRKYRDYLTNSENISLFPIDMNIADYVVELTGKILL